MFENGIIGTCKYSFESIENIVWFTLEKLKTYTAKLLYKMPVDTGAGIIANLLMECEKKSVKTAFYDKTKIIRRLFYYGKRKRVSKKVWFPISQTYCCPENDFIARWHAIASFTLNYSQFTATISGF